MLQKPRTLPRIDLTHHHLTALSLNLTVEWDDELDELFGWDDELGHLFGDIMGDSAPLIFTYKQRKTTYAILVINTPSVTSDDEMLIGIRYTVVPQVINVLPRQAETERAFLRRLGQLPVRQPVAVEVEYDFGEVKPADLWYPLPNRVGAPSESPLIEIHGIRGAKLSDADASTEFLFTLDRVEDSVVLLLDFQTAPHFDIHTPEQVLEQADTYARHMVRA